MQKPNSYDTTSAGGWTPIAVGGHKAIIKAAEETQSKTGKPMLKVAIEFDKGDEQEGYFANEFKNDTREDKKWPFAGTLYILSEDNNGICTRKFKSFITSLEKSNPGLEIVWGKDMGAQIKNKKIGIVYGEEEQEYDGRTSMRRVWKYTCEYSKATEQSIPSPKYLNKEPVSEGGADFLNIASSVEEDVPF